MKRHLYLPLRATAAAALALSGAASAQDTESATEPQGPLYMPLLPITALTGHWSAENTRALQLALAHVTDEKFQFGQYNGLNESGTTVIGNLRWQDLGGDSYWRTSVSDLGLDTREGYITWGRADRLRLQLDFDSQLQVRNDTGRSPYRGSQALTLPGEWVSGSTTSTFASLQTSLGSIDREVERETLSIQLDYRLNSHWALDSSLSYEDKSGTTDTGAAIYVDAATGDAAILPQDIDYRTTEFAFGIRYSGTELHFNGSVDYSDFDNQDEVLSWQNAYAGFGPDVRYPSGYGGLGVAPDNQQTRGRVSGQYIMSPQARFQFDGSYALLSQDQDYLDYTVNPALTISEPLPRNNFDGEVEASTLHVALLLRPVPKFNVKAYYKARDRDYDTPRDGYRYNRGDATDQPRQALTVYNTANDYTSQTLGLDVDYRLPLRSRLSLDYAYELVERRNAAVDETKEDRYTLAYRIQPWSNFTARLEASFANRNAGLYNWDQDYFALLDVDLINATPDNQRYINHPELSQYHLSNRERTQAKADLTWQPQTGWHLNLTLQWRDDDYDESALGLTGSTWERVHFSASYALADSLTASLYAGYDQFDSSQRGRSFRGGQEKNAFEIYRPLPQASDPARNWALDAADDSLTAGASLQWQPAEDWLFTADYSFVDTRSRQGLSSQSLAVTDLPEVDTHLHHLTASGTWNMSKAISLRLDYQYYRYKSDDYALTGSPTGIDKVLTLGERNPNEQIHYVGASAIYRWQ